MGGVVALLWGVYFVAYLFLFLFGACIGSFLNVVAWRVPQGISVAKGRSFCPACGKTLGPAELVPVFSYLFLRGKCRGCGAKIPPRDTVMEALTGLMAMGLFRVYGFSWKMPAVFLLAAVLLPIALIDHDTMTIPNGLVIALAVAALAFPFAFPEVGWLERAIGVFAASLPLFLALLLLPGSFGGGDVKLMAAAGFALGWQNILLALFFGVVACGVWTVVRLLMKKVKKGQHIPFGPWLCGGVLLAQVFGGALLEAYLGLFGLSI